MPVALDEYPQHRDPRPSVPSADMPSRWVGMPSSSIIARRLGPSKKYMYTSSATLEGSPQCRSPRPSVPSLALSLGWACFIRFHFVLSVVPVLLTIGDNLTEVFISDSRSTGSFIRNCVIFMLLRNGKSAVSSWSRDCGSRGDRGELVSYWCILQVFCSLITRMAMAIR